MFKRREKAGTHLKADRENEQDEAKLLDKLECRRINGHAQMANEKAAKQDKGRTQRDAENLDLA